MADIVQIEPEALQEQPDIFEQFPLQLQMETYASSVQASWSDCFWNSSTSALMFSIFITAFDVVPTLHALLLYLFAFLHKVVVIYITIKALTESAC